MSGIENTGSKTLNKFIELHRDKIDSCFHDSDGYWIYLNNVFKNDDCGTIIHEETVTETMSAFTNLVEVCSPTEFMRRLEDAYYAVTKDEIKLWEKLTGKELGSVIPVKVH